MISIFRYDPSIKIVAPQVAPDAPEAPRPANNPAAAQTDCRTDALKARAAILGSGPFRLDARETRAYGLWNRHRAGEVEPYRAMHLVLDPASDEHVNEDREFISIGDQKWRRGAAVWFQPERNMTFGLGFATPQMNNTLLVTVKCLGQVKIDGESLTGYELQNADLSGSVVESVFVAPGSGLTVRYERRPSDERFISVISTFHYDPSIKIEPPQVAPDAPEAQQRGPVPLIKTAPPAAPKVPQGADDLVNPYGRRKF